MNEFKNLPQEEFLKKAFPNMNYLMSFKAGQAFGDYALMKPNSKRYCCLFQLLA